MKRIIRLTESQLTKLVDKLIYEIKEDGERLEYLLDELKGYGLEDGDYAIFGSAPLVVKGLLDDVNDLDVIIKPSKWIFEDNEYRTEDIEFFNNWPGFDIDDLIDNKSFEYNGFRFVNVDEVIRYKKMLKRKKDKKFWDK
jgi:hypothetical protein